MENAKEIAHYPPIDISSAIIRLIFFLLLLLSFSTYSIPRLLLLLLQKIPETRRNVQEALNKIFANDTAGGGGEG